MVAEKPKRAPRVPKAKAAAAVAEPAVVVEPVAAPAAPAVGEVTVAVVADVPADAEIAVADVAEAAGTKRQQTSKAIGVFISAARTRRHLDKMNLNAKVDAMIAEVKTELNAYKDAQTHLQSGVVSETVVKEVEGVAASEVVERALTDAEKAAFQATVDRLAPLAESLEQKASALSRERIRFSSESAIVLSIVCDEIVQQLAEHTMLHALAAKKKIIQVEHLHVAGVEKLSLYPLFKTLPSFAKLATQLATAAAAEAEETLLSTALVQAERDFKKKYNVHAKKKKAGEVVAEAAPEAPEAPVVADLEDDSESKTTFKFYVGQVCKELVKRRPEFSTIRVSTEIRNYLSDILVEFIQRMASLVHLTALCMKNKTINDSAILRTVEGLIIDGHKCVETIEFHEEEFVDPEALKAEFAKRDAEKLAGRVHKIETANLPRVKGPVAVRTLRYPDSGFEELNTKIREKLALHTELMKKVEVEEPVPA